METMQYKMLVQTFLDLGEAMLSAGAEVSRAEETLDRLSRAYGAVGTDVFVITSSIVVTFSFPDGTVITESRRLRRGTDYDFEKLSAFNALSRACAVYPLSREELKERIRTIAEKRPSPVKLYVGSALAAGAFCVFFGGSVWDGLLSALFGLLVCLLQLHLSPLCPNRAFFLFASAFLCGCGICGLGRLLPLATDMIIIGDIMLLVPGIAITTAARDMVVGDTISGATRLLECLLGAATLAAGFILSILILGR